MDITGVRLLIGVFALAIGLGLVFRGFKRFMQFLPAVNLGYYGDPGRGGSVGGPTVAACDRRLRQLEVGCHARRP